MNKKLFIVFTLLATLRGIAAADCTDATGASPCSGSTPYCDLSLSAGSRVCVAVASCSGTVPYGDPTTKTCVAQASCDATGNPYADPTTKLCVTATGCNTANPYSDSGASPKVCVSTCSATVPYGDPTAKTCVATTGCNTANPYSDSGASPKVCVSTCSATVPYGDPTSKTCVAANGCNAANQYADPSSSPKKCVVATSCNSANPYGDPTAKACVLASACNAANQYADPTTKTCVAASGCNTVNPISDPTTKTCVTTSGCNTANPYSDSTVSPKVCVVAGSCSAAVQYGDKNTGACVATCPTGSTADTTTKTCPLIAVTPTTSSPGSAFNVTPALVYTTTDTTAPAFTAVDGTPYFGPGSDSTSAYVWLAVNPASTTGSTYSVNKRTVNTSGTFAKSNTTADVAITTGVLKSAAVSTGTAPGWMWIVSINCGYTGTSCNWNSIGGTAVTQEITLNYVAGTGSSMTTKALTGNTNANVFFNVKTSWYNNGTIFVAYVMSTRTTGATTGSVADTWAANGLYIQGVNVTSGALYYNTTGGVKAIAMTQTASGASTCISAASSATANCASNYYSGTGVGDALDSFTVYAMNWTTTDTVQYGWVDRTSITAVVYKTGTINCTTGAATSGTTLATTAADAVSGTTTTSTSYSFLGGLASMGTYGVFLKKTVTATNTATTPSTVTTTYTIQGFLNGSSTANTNFTVASGYNPSSITGYHTSDGFVLMETQYSTATTTPAQPTLLQAERFFTNGSAYSTAVNLGTYGAGVSTYQDTNGSVIVGYTISDSSSGKTYSGYMGTYIAQNLAGVSLTTIFGLLCFMIVALFAF